LGISSNLTRTIFPINCAQFDSHLLNRNTRGRFNDSAFAEMKLPGTQCNRIASNCTIAILQNEPEFGGP
jgi:hypothetical protein